MSLTSTPGGRRGAGEPTRSSPIDALGFWHAVLWVKGHKGDYELIDLQEDLNELEDDQILMGVAYDVGEDGTVVGRALAYDEDINFLGVAPFSWTAEDGAVLLDQDKTGSAVAWKKVSKYIAGGIGGGWGMSDDAVVWTNGDLEILPDLDDFPYMKASSVTGSGLVVGYAYDENFARTQGWYAEKK